MTLKKESYNPNNLSNFCIEQYFEDIKNRPQLGAEEENRLVNKVKEGDEEAIKRLIEGNLKFVITVAKKYKDNGLSLSDLINEGNFGLIKAAKKFDPDMGYRFISYAVWWIKQSIRQSLNDNSRTIRYPNSLINKVNKVKKNLNINDVSELEEHENEIGVELPTCIFYDDAVDNNDNGYTDLSIEDEEEDIKIKESAKENEDNMKTELQRTMEILDERERNIIEKYYGINRNDERTMTLEELGEEHDLTKERVRQLKKIGMRKLRSNVDNLHKFIE